MREHIILNPSRYRRNGFIAAFHSQVRFLFPSIHDAYTYNPDNGQLSFSHLWLDRRDNIACWTVTNDFLHWYPEFVDDIPVFDQKPRRLQPTGVGMGTGPLGPVGNGNVAPEMWNEWCRERQERFGESYERQERFSEPHRMRVRDVKDEEERRRQYALAGNEGVERARGSPENPRWATQWGGF